MSQLSQESRLMGYYQVEKIVGCRVVNGKKKYYWVKWKGWPSSTNTWQTEKNLETVKDLVQEFENSKAIRTHKVQNNNLSEEIQTKPCAKSPIESQRQEKRKRGRPRLAPELRKNKFIQKTKQISDEKKVKRRVLGSSLSNVSNRRKRMASVRRASENKNERKTKLRVPRKILVYQFQKKRKGLRGQQEALLLNNLSRKKSHQQENESNPEISSDDSGSDEFNIIEILQNCQNYPKVKVNFKQNKFYFTIPYKEEGKVKSLSLTTSEIIKINPFWLTKFYEGFFV